MDRNAAMQVSRISVIVALRKESVDRNAGDSNASLILVRSLSARRAWIEISAAERLLRPESVALRKESVDRNIVVISSNTVARI